MESDAVVYPRWVWCLVLVVLASLIAEPGILRAKAEGDCVQCRSNMKNIGTALEMYSTDNSGCYPIALRQVVPTYLQEIPTCPSAGRDTYSAGYASFSKPDEYTVVCRGENHPTLGLGPNYPRYGSPMRCGISM